jgi:predicted RNase H-like HicB family nuclease
MAKHDELYVEKRPSDGKWVVKKPKAERVSAVVNTKREAIKRAKELAPEGVIHLRENGRLTKIQ